MNLQHSQGSPGGGCERLRRRRGEPDGAASRDEETDAGTDSIADCATNSKSTSAVGT